MADGILDPASALKPLKSISPSRFCGMGKCRLREIWAAGWETPRLPRSPTAQLGTAIHLMFEEAERGGLPTEQAIQTKWDAELSKVESAMSKNWLDRMFVPLRRHVRGMEIRRLAAFARVRQIALLSRESSGGTGEFGAECQLTSNDGSVRGRLDVVYLDTDGVVIRDYKTGSLYDEDEQSNQVIKPDYVIQLLMYAALYFENHGVWPSRLELCGMSEAVQSIPFTHAECLELLANAKAMLSETNLQILAVQEGGLEADTLAAPHAQTCRYCTYRPICKAYRKSNVSQIGVAGSRSGDVWGKVISITTARNGLVAICMTDERTNGGEITVERLDAALERNPALQFLTSGSSIGVFNANATHSSGTLKGGDYTVLYAVSA